MGHTIVSAAVIDDVLSLVLLAVLTAVIRTGSLPDWNTVGSIALEVCLFFAITFFVGLFVLPRLGRAIRHLWADEFEFSGLLVVALAGAVLAEALQLHFIVGAFMAGLFFGRRTMGDDAYRAVRERISGLTTGFLGPIFFASIGLQLHVGAITAIPGLVVLLVALAIVAKLVGAGIPAYFTGLSGREATGVGVGMSARGAVELIIADIALQAGLFDWPDPPPPIVENLFSAIVIVAIVTTIFAPIAMQWMFRREQAEET
jgi:Kef-type K+ transport system membrane component KefB